MNTAQIRKFAAKHATSAFDAYNIERVLRVVLATRKPRRDRSSGDILAAMKRGEPALVNHVLAALR